MIYLHSDLPVGPPLTHHTHHDIHDTYICQIFDSQNINLSNLQQVCVWKHVFEVNETPENLSKIPGNTFSDVLRHLKKRSASSRGDQVHKCSLFLFPVPTRHHWENTLFTVPVPWILTGKSIAEFFCPIFWATNELKCFASHHRKRSHFQPPIINIADMYAQY